MTTLLGILSGVVLFFTAIFYQGGVGAFLNLNALMITLGGTLAATFISFPLPKVMKVFGVFLNIFRKDIREPSGYVALIVRLAEKGRQQSILSLEEEIKTINNRFLRSGIEMIVDGHPAEIVRDVLETELEFTQQRHEEGTNIFRTMGRFAPAFGLVGTLIGLIGMLRGVGDANTADTIGPSMAVALVTTFYGAMLANLFLIPVAEKLTSRTNQETLQAKMIIEGVLLIQQGLNPRLVEKKLNAFMPPDLRRTYRKKRTVTS